MPTTYWDLRRILDVNPEEDRLCVGFAPSKGRRCKNPINQYDRPAAGRLLDQMDRSTHLLDTIKDLEMLATLLLCKGVHIKPQHSQVRVVYGKWERRVTEEHLRLRERAEREAERETERIAEHVAGAERADAERLAERVAEISRRVERMVEQIAEAERVDEERLAARVAERDAERTTAADVMSEVEEEIQKVVRSAGPVLEQSPSSDITDIEDPFVTQEASSSRPNLFTHFIPTNNNEEAEGDIEDESILSGTFTSEEKVDTPEFLPYMPSPPKHDPFLPIMDHKIAIVEQQETGTNATTSESSSMPNFTHVFGVRSISDFQFETPIRLRTTPEEKFSSAGTASSTTVSSFSAGTASSSAATTPEKAAAEEPERISPEKGEDRATNVVISNNFGSSTYESGAGSGEKLVFEHSITPQKPSILYNPTTPSSFSFQCISAEDPDLNAQITSTQATKRRAVGHSTPINESPSGNLSQPSTQQSHNEDSFGHADITPNSTRYTTYLPARQQHGLLTPPESPEMLMGALRKPTSDPGYFREDRRREDRSPIPRITRKPLPRSPPKAHEGGLGQEQVCNACGKIDGLRTVQCGCNNEEIAVPSGCLQRFGFRRLKEKVKAMRESFGKRSESATPSSSERTALE